MYHPLRIPTDTIVNQAELTDEVRALQRATAYAEALELLEDDSELVPELALLKGLCLFMNGERESGMSFLQASLEEDPADPAWQSDLALAALLCGDLPRAEALAAAVVENEAPSAVDYSRLAAVRLAGNQLDSATELYREAAVFAHSAIN